MSDIEMKTPAKADTTTGEKDGATKAEMPQGDVDFIMTCIKNASDGALIVDATKIAQELGYANVRSVGNRIGTIKKKYGLAISVSKGSTAAASSGDASAPITPKAKKVAAPKTPKTPKVAADKVTKAKATPKAKTPAKKKATKSKATVESNNEIDQEMKDNGDDMAVKDTGDENEVEGEESE